MVWKAYQRATIGMVCAVAAAVLVAPSAQAGCTSKAFGGISDTNCSSSMGGPSQMDDSLTSDRLTRGGFGRLRDASRMDDGAIHRGPDRFNGASRHYDTRDGGRIFSNPGGRGSASRSHRRGRRFSYGGRRDRARQYRGGTHYRLGTLRGTTHRYRSGRHYRLGTIKGTSRRYSGASRYSFGSRRATSRRKRSVSDYVFGSLKSTSRQHRSATDYSLGTVRGSSRRYGGSSYGSLGTVRGRSRRYGGTSFGRGSFRPR